MSVVGADATVVVAESNVVMVEVVVAGVSVVEVLVGVVSTDIELSTSIATTSEGDEPHEATTNNIEKAKLGAMNRERRGFTAKDYAGEPQECELNPFRGANGMSDG